jgi:hypothetical protein
MTRKRLLLLVACLVVGWLLTLGLHSSRYVRAYCQGHEQYGQPEVYVFFMEPVHDTCGIPLLCTHYEDALPYPLEIAVTVDDRIPGDGVVIESLEVTFADGQTASVVAPDYPRGGPFGTFEPVPSERVPGRTFRRARVGIPRAIWTPGSFQMSVRGYIYGGDKQPFERRLRMDYSRDSSWCTGWFLYVIAPTV